MIKLTPISWKNLDGVLNISISKSQMHYVKSISTFMAQSYVNLTLGYEDKSLAVYDNDTLIGYVKLVFVPKEETVYEMEDDSIMIDALVIDKAFQGQGYGKRILDAIMNSMASLFSVPTSDMSLVIHDENERAIRLARRYGFTFYKTRSSSTPMSIYLLHS